MVKSLVKSYSFLAAGSNLTQTAKLTGLSIPGVLKQARKYVAEGRLVRIAKGRYQKPILTSFTPPHVPVGTFNQNTTPPTPLPTMLPSKFGGIFAVVGNPRIKYDQDGKFYVKTQLYTAQVGRYKAQIWLKGGFTGSTVEEIIANGQAQLQVIASQLAADHHLELGLLRFYDGIEWVDYDLKRSQRLATSAKIPKGGAIEVAGAIHKYSDFSHPSQVQFNPKPGGDAARPTDHAKIHEYVYKGRIMEDIYAITQALKQLTDLQIEIKARMDLRDQNK
jgi:hypothetical protein